jgi:hypothetical protein
MEKVLVGVALTGAALIALSSTIGGDGFHVRFHDHEGHDDRAVMMAAASGKPETMASQTFAGARLRFDQVAAIVTVTPEARADIAVEISNPGFLPMPKVSLDGDRVVINGGLGRTRRCSITSSNGSGAIRYSFGFAGGAEANEKQIPSSPSRRQKPSRWNRTGPRF